VAAGAIDDYLDGVQLLDDLDGISLADAEVIVAAVDQLREEAEARDPANRGGAKDADDEPEPEPQPRKRGRPRKAKASP
jgi:hypothetical protein